MADRPEWVLVVKRYLDDIDALPEFPDSAEDDDVLDSILIVVNAVLCGTYGHEIVDDQCMRPEHRLCIHCLRLETDIEKKEQVT